MNNLVIFQGKNIFVEIHESEIPWLKIFTNTPFKEFSECDLQTKSDIFEALNIIEKQMLDFYNPTKINIASFGNYLPHVHFHIMARFSNDSYFPEPMWGAKQRQGEYKIENFEKFCEIVKSLFNQNPSII